MTPKETKQASIGPTIGKLGAVFAGVLIVGLVLFFIFQIIGKKIIQYRRKEEDIEMVGMKKVDNKEEEYVFKVISYLFSERTQKSK